MFTKGALPEPLSNILNKYIKEEKEKYSKRLVISIIIMSR
jgi:hypothetical protein